MKLCNFVTVVGLRVDSDYGTTLQMLQQRAHRRASSTLKMSDVSPKLANLNATKIAMPGVVSASHQVSIIMFLW